MKRDHGAIEDAVDDSLFVRIVRLAASQYDWARGIFKHYDTSNDTTRIVCGYRNKKTFPWCALGTQSLMHGSARGPPRPCRIIFAPSVSVRSAGRYMPGFLLPPSRIDANLIDAFGSRVYAIGGRVRDALFNAAHGTNYALKDYDYVVVNTSFETARDALQQMGRLDLAGASFAIFKATIDGTTVDVALPRRERSTGTGHRDFHVDFGPEVRIQEDMARRDFTINAISYRLADGRLEAAPRALDDIQNRLLRALGENAFRDDPLRIWRGAQFAARFNLAVDPDTRQQMKRDACLATTVCAERVNEEITKMLAKAERPSIGLELARETGVLQLAIPDLADAYGCDQNVYHTYDVWGHTLAAVDASRRTLLNRLSALLHDIGKPSTRSAEPGPHGYTFYNHDHQGAQIARTVLRNLKFPNETVDRVARLVDNHMYVADLDLRDAALRRLIRRIGEDNIDLQMQLRLADLHGRDETGLSHIDARVTRNVAFAEHLREVLATEPALNVRDLAVNGHDVIGALVDAGVKPPDYRGDAAVSSVLGTLLEDVTDRPELNDREALLDRLASHACSMRPKIGLKI